MLSLSGQDGVRVRDHRLDFLTVANDARIVHDLVDARVVESRDSIRGRTREETVDNRHVAEAR